MTLRKIASHCVEETDGYSKFARDDLSYQAKFVEACKQAGIRADIVTERSITSRTICKPGYYRGKSTGWRRGPVSPDTPT